MTLKLPRIARHLGLLGVVFVLLAGCQKSAKHATPATPVVKKWRIAVIPKATTHSYWKATEAGARRAAAEFNVDLEWQGPLDDSKVADQIGIFDNLAASGVNGILLAPCDDKALAPHVRTVAKRGIPVAIFDSPLDARAGVDYINFTGTDNMNAGASGAKELARLVDTPLYGGRILMVRFTEGSSSTRLREEGFMKQIEADGKLSIAEKQFTDGSMAGAQRVAEALLNSAVKDNRLELDGVFASNQPAAEGTYNALKSLRDSGVKVTAKFVCFDDSKLLKEGLKNGVISALMIQDTEEMGYMGVKSLVDHLDKKPVEAYIDTGVTVLLPEAK